MALLKQTEVLEHDIRTMGRALGTRVHYITHELATITHIWDVHEVVFGTRDGVELSNVIGNFSATIQMVLYEHVVVGLCRLTDRSKGTNKVGTLPRLVKEELRESCHKLVKDAENAARELKSLRDNRLAHSNLDYLQHSDQIDRPARIAVTDTISKIHQVIDFLSREYQSSTLGWTPLGNEAGAEFIQELIRAREFRELEDARIAGGGRPRRLWPSWLSEATELDRYNRSRIDDVLEDQFEEQRR
ncbi:MAG: hypothetical protein ABL307_03830 [Roseitalea porphyridii]|uniref:AbiU2 domain-containing protein n=1 Tax=Roseitalea porphyridii TaxID=1852022 RepID=UPI0032D99FB2